MFFHPFLAVSGEWFIMCIQSRDYTRGGSTHERPLVVVKFLFQGIPLQKVSWGADFPLRVRPIALKDGHIEEFYHGRRRQQDQEGSN
jgi:hypothetical protein